jgi:hypothetical protein
MMSPSTAALRASCWVIPIEKGKMSQGADIWAAVDVQGPSSAVRVPNCWSAAPKARPKSAARRKAIERMVALQGSRFESST